MENISLPMSVDEDYYVNEVLLAEQEFREGQSAKR